MAYRSKNAPPLPIEDDVAEQELEKKRALLRRVKMTKERLIANRGAVIAGDPSKHYIWVNRNEHRQNWFLGQEYEVCRTRTLSDSEAASATTGDKDAARKRAERDAKRQRLEGKVAEKFIEDAVAAVKPVIKWPTTQWEQADGTHVRGDLILYQIDKDLYEAMHEQEVGAGLDDIEAHKDVFEGAARARGAPAFVEHSNA